MAEKTVQLKDSQDNDLFPAAKTGDMINDAQYADDLKVIEEADSVIDIDYEVVH